MSRSRRNGSRWWASGGASRALLLASPDERLVELVLAGDDAAFEVLFDRHVADALSLWFAREALGSWGEAEEAVRHSFAAAHAYLASRDREVEFAPWLHTILGNHCLSMLHARESRPGGEEPGPLAPVIDLDEWRRRRGGLGAVAVPAALSAGLRDSVLAACGIGTGAAGGAAAVGGWSLLGGLAAKVAVVALLAGGVGAVGGAVSERGEVGGSGGAPVVRDQGTILAGGGQPALAAPGFARAALPASVARGRWVDRESRGGRSVDRVSRSWRSPAGLERRADASPGGPGATAPGTTAPGGGGPGRGGPGSSPVPVAGISPAGGAARLGSDLEAKAGRGAPAVDSLRRAVAEPVGMTLSRVGELVGGRAGPPPAPATGVRPPLPVAVPKIGDDLRVTTGKLTADVRALLSPGSSAQPR